MLFEAGFAIRTVQNTKVDGILGSGAGTGRDGDTDRYDGNSVRRNMRKILLPEVTIPRRIEKEIEVDGQAYVTTLHENSC